MNDEEKDFFGVFPQLLSMAFFTRPHSLPHNLPAVSEDGRSASTDTRFALFHGVAFVEVAEDFWKAFFVVAIQ